MARPTIRTPEMVARILERVSGGELGCDVCNGKDGMPSWSSFKEWRVADPELSAAYARAHEAGVEHDESVAYREAMRQPADSVDAQAQRTRLDWLKFRLSKRLPKDFGDKSHVEHSGTISDGLTEEQRTQRIAEILRTAKVRKGSNTQSGDVDGGAAKLSRNPKP